MRLLKGLYICLFTLLISCNEDYTVVQPDFTLIVNADDSVVSLGNTITFNAVTNAGDNVTENTVFSVDNSTIVGNSFTATNLGSYQVIANYGGKASEPITVRFFDPSEVNFKKRVLVEDYTGTWCGFCTRVSYAIGQIEAQTSNVVAVAIHRASSVPTNSDYDPYNFDSSALEATLAAVGYPKGYLNRTIQWTSPEDFNIDQVLNLTQGEAPKLGLKLKTEVTGNTANVDVKVLFGQDYSNLKLVLYVLENGLIHYQKNYTNHYGGLNPIPNYIHNHVLRSCETSLFGDAISNTESVTDNEFLRSFTIQLPSSIEDSTNLDFVAFIIDENGTVVNVRKAGIGYDQVYEVL